jgi:hypothetical protein
MSKQHSIAIVLAFAVLAPAGLLAQAGAAAVAVSSTPESLYSYPDYDVRYGIAPGTDLEALAGKTATLGMDVKSFTDPLDGKGKLRGFGESHGLYDVALEDVLASLWDIESQPKFFSNLFEARVEDRGENEMRVFQYIGVSVLGIRAGYHMRVEMRRDYLPDGSVGIRSRLLECRDGNMFESYSSYYLARVEVNGKPMTYIRLYSRPGIVDPFPGTAAIVKGLTPGQLSDSITLFVRDARRRAAERS